MECLVRAMDIYYTHIDMNSYFLKRQVLNWLALKRNSYNRSNEMGSVGAAFKALTISFNIISGPDLREGSTR